MKYLADLHTWVTDVSPDQEVSELIEEFVEKIAPQEKLN